MVEYHAYSMGTLRKFIDKCNIDAETLYDEAMRSHTTFRIGGPADAFVRPRTPEAFSRLLFEAAAEGIPVALVGGGANLLVADSGIRGIVASTAFLRSLSLQPDGSTYAGAGFPVVGLVGEALHHGLSGLEFAAGLPGSIGGAVFMNARCYDMEFADIIETVDYLVPGSHAAGGVTPGTTAIDRSDWAYKHTPFMPGGQLEGALILGANLRLAPGDPVRIAARMRELEADRVAKGRFDYPSAGSLFRNNRAFGRPVGKLLDELGFRGRRVGDAMVNPKHANIFVNAGNATASDMVRLIDEARAAAMDAFGFELVPEVVLLGDFQSRS
jgi:UDP-N-acetylmuramate dehydrogenase